MNNVLAGALGDYCRTFLTDVDPAPLRDRVKEARTAPKGDLLSWGETPPGSPTHVTTASEELFLKQSSFILIKSRCSFKAAVAAKMPWEPSPAKTRTPELPKNFTKPPQKNQTKPPGSKLNFSSKTINTFNNNEQRMNKEIIHDFSLHGKEQHS